MGFRRHVGRGVFDPGPPGHASVGIRSGLNTTRCFEGQSGPRLRDGVRSALRLPTGTDGVSSQWQRVEAGPSCQPCLTLVLCPAMTIERLVTEDFFTAFPRK